MSPSGQAQPAKLITAATRDGIDLPVIDVTDPRFAVPDDRESLQRLFKLSMDEESSRRRVPSFIMSWMLKSAARRSYLVRALFDGDATFLDGISTYLMKLGADNLPPPFDGPTDKKIAASSHLTLLRLRTQQVARLVVEGITPALERAPSAPLHLINIAGGPSIDSMNTLIILKRHTPDLLRRPIAIHVLDQDDAGPFFGRNALAALMRDEGPLSGFDINFDHRPYDWNDPAPLEALLRDIDAASAITAASSEGGLFDYGTDEAVVANLSVLRAGGVNAVAGSVTTDDEYRRRLITASRFKLVPRGLKGFQPLAACGGFTIARAESAQLSDQVLLQPDPGA